MATLTTSYQLIASKYIGTVSGSGVAAKDIYIRIYAKYNSQSLVNNTSSVSYKSVLYSSGTGTYFYTGTPTTKSLSGSGATAASGDAQGNYYLGETTLHEISGTVSHSSTGSASVSVTASWNSVPWGVSGSVTGSADLPLIARATQPTISATSITMGGSATITMTAANSTFKHKLRYNFGGVRGSATGFSIGAEFTKQGTSTATFTPPTSLGSEIPNATSGGCSIICYTYLADGTHIGTTYLNVTLNVPSYTPSISNLTLTGNKLLSSTYVQGKSTVSVNANVATQYGAQIKSISATVDGKTYTSLPFTTSALSTGSKSVKITFTDSRNKSVTAESAAFTVYAYAAPTITELTFARQSNGTTVIATVKGSVASVNSKNAKTIKVVLNGVTNTITSSSYTINGTTTFTGVPTDNTLTGTATITDSYTSVSKTAVLPTVAVTMDFYKDGTGIAMGKVAEKSGLLDVAWPIKMKCLKFQRGARPTSANISPDSDYVGSIEYFTASSAMTEGKPPTVDGQSNSTDGHILHFHWDGTNGFDSQLFVRNSTGSILTRGCNAGTWGPWKQILDISMCKDYVIETGTSGGWEYTKWNSGKMELFAERSLSFPEGAKQTDYLWRSIVSINLSSLLTKIMSGTCSIQTNGMVPQVCRHSTNLATAEIVIVTSRTIPAFTITAPVYIIGKWK